MEAELLNEMNNKGSSPERIYRVFAECLHEEDQIVQATQMQDTGVSPGSVL
jgi:hypothetical protein